MSMISKLIDELRQMADGQATYRDAREVMLKAADAITELRGAMLVASVDYRHLSDENAKLRELMADLAICACGKYCYGCPHQYDGCDRDQRLRELGVEMDDGQQRNV